METSCQIQPNFKLIQALMYVIVTCKYEMDQEQPRIKALQAAMKYQFNTNAKNILLIFKG